MVDAKVRKSTSLLERQSFCKPGSAEGLARNGIDLVFLIYCDILQSFNMYLNVSQVCVCVCVSMGFKDMMVHSATPKRSLYKQGTSIYLHGSCAIFSGHDFLCSYMGVLPFLRVAGFVGSSRIRGELRCFGDLFFAPIFFCRMIQVPSWDDQGVYHNPSFVPTIPNFHTFFESGEDMLVFLVQLGCYSDVTNQNHPKPPWK